MRSPLSDLIRQAHVLSAERDQLVEAIARRWAVALRDQPLSAQDLEEFWAGLAEEAVRGLLRDGPRRWARAAVRQEAAEVIARVRARVERALREPGHGRTLDA